MNNPKVSVIIPAYNGAAFLSNTIQSVLDQTYPDFELIIVDDVSPDHTGEVVGKFHDPRVRYLLHEENMGVAIARRTGLHASSGEIIAYLDQDDLFHPEKLQRHVEIYKISPETGFTYNAFFDLGYSSRKVRNIRRPPRVITLADLVLGFPIPPSSWVMMREWAFSEELWDENTFLHGSEVVHLGRLYLAGCKFTCVDQALQYRNYHSGRVYRDLRGKCEAELNCQKMIFEDPRCPPEVLALQNVAFSSKYLDFCGYALVQCETDLAQEYLRNAVQLNPAILEGNPSVLVQGLVEVSIADDSADHESLLREIFGQLPPELTWLSEQYEWAVGQGYLEKGTRAVIWDRLADGKRYLAEAKRHGVKVDETFLNKLTYQLMNYEHEFGDEAVKQVLGKLEPLYEQLSSKKMVRQLRGNYLLNVALRDYRSGNYSSVPKNVLAAISNEPSYLVNRGAISILLRSSLSRKPAQ